MAGAAAPVAGGIGRRHGVKRLGEADPKVVAALDFGVGTAWERRADLAGGGGFRRLRQRLRRDARRRRERDGGFIGGRGRRVAWRRGQGRSPAGRRSRRAVAAADSRLESDARRRRAVGPVGLSPGWFSWAGPVRSEENLKKNHFAESKIK